MSQQDTDRRCEKLGHRQELPENKVESDMKVLQAERREAKAENDSAFERLRANMEKSVNSITTRLVIGLTVGLTISVAFLSLVVAVTGLSLRT